MLDKLRKGAGGWVAQLFIAVLVLSFAVWGVSGFFNGFRADTISTVGKTDISIQSFQRQYDLAMRQMTQQFGQQLTSEQAQAFGLPGQVLGRLLAEATLDDAAGSLRLGISNKTLAQEIIDDPSFRGQSGAFDKNYFLQLLRSNGMNQDQYIAERRAVYVRQQIADGLIGGLQVPETYLQALHEYRSDARKIRYLVLAPAIVGDVGSPSDADLNTYFAAHKDDWKAPEFRAITFIQLAPTDLAKADEVNDEEAKKAYDTQLATRFTSPEKRQVQQIVFKDRAEAAAAAAALTGGKSFADLIADRKLKPEDVDLGLITRDKIADPTVAAAAFGLAAGGASGVVDGKFGPVIVHVDTVEPQVVKTFDEVKDQLKQEIATQRAAAAITGEHDRIEDARAAGKTIAEIGQEFGLKPVTVAAVDAAGSDPEGKPVADLPKTPDFLTQAFATDVGIENDPVQIDPTSFVWYEVASVTAAHDRKLEEVKDKVVAAWKKSKVDEKLAAKAAEVHDRIVKGEDIAKLAGELSVEVKTTENLTRATPASADLSMAAIHTAFGGPKGFTAIAPGVDGESEIILVVDDSSVPVYAANAPDLAQGKQQMATQMSDDILRQYIALMQTQIGVSVNQAALQQAVGTPPGS